MELSKKQKQMALVGDVAGLLTTLFIINGLKEEETTMESLKQQEAIELMIKVYGEDFTLQVIDTAIEYINELELIAEGIHVKRQNDVFVFVQPKREEPSLEGMN